MPKTDEWAAEMAGNWKEFGSFYWSGEPAEDGHLWAHMGLSHRDSDCRGESNAASLLAIMREEHGDNEGETWREECHGHWAVGHVDVLTFKALTCDASEGGVATPEAITLHGICAALEEYPVLDDEDCSQREYDCALEMIHAAVRFPEDPPCEEWAEEVFSWLFDHYSDEVCSPEACFDYKHAQEAAEALWPELFAEDEEDEGPCDTWIARHSAYCGTDQELGLFFTEEAARASIADTLRRGRRRTRVNVLKPGQSWEIEAPSDEALCPPWAGVLYLVREGAEDNA